MFLSRSKPQISDLWKLWEGDSRHLTSHVTEPLTQGSLHSQASKKAFSPCASYDPAQMCTEAGCALWAFIHAWSQGWPAQKWALGPGHIPAARNSSSRFVGRSVQGFQWFIWMLAQVISFISFSLFFHDLWLWHVPQYCLCWVSARISWGQFKSSHN